MSKVAAILGPAGPQIDTRMNELQAVVDRVGGVEIKHVDSDLPEAELIEQLKGTIAIMPAGRFEFTSELVNKLPNLRLIQTFSAGTDYLDKTMLAENGVDVANNGGANAVAVAEHAIALMFAVNRKLVMQLDSVREGEWMAGVTGERTDFHTLVGKRIGIVGLGRIGSRVAKRLAGWECELVYYDVVDHDDAYVASTGAKRVELDELLSTSDIVTLHVPLDRLTKHMISDRELSLMKDTAILINTCRGPVVDEAALIRGLEAKEIFAAGLDVTEIEPIEMDNPLLKMPNVTITPHLATRAIESEYNAAENAITNIARLARGEKPDWIVAPV